MKKVAAYIRVSTNDQSTQLQRDDLTSFAKSRGWSVQTIFDETASGTDCNRPEFQKMLKSARVRKFDVLLLWRFDRMGRSLRQLVTTLQELNELGVEVISLKDQVDTTTSSGKLMFHLLASFSEFEASLIRERVTAGVRAKIKRSGRWGPARRRDDAAAIEPRSEGLSVREIAKRLNTSPSSVHRSLTTVPRTQI